MDPGHQHAFGLLRGALCDLLPACRLFFGFFAVQADDAPFHLHRNDLVSPQFHRLLDDQFHLVSLGKTLEQEDTAGKFIIRLLGVKNVKKNLLFPQSLNGTVIFFFLAVADPQFFPLPHTQHVGYVIYICPCYMDLMRGLVDLMRFYKKTLHFSSCLSSVLFSENQSFLAVTDTHSPCLVTSTS